MVLDVILHALREIWSKPPLLLCASLALIVLFAFLVLLVVLAVTPKRHANERSSEK